MLYIAYSPSQGGKVVLGEPVHSHQVDVRVLLPLELLPAHVARSVHVQLHVRVKLERIGIAGFTDQDDVFGP